MKNFSLLRTCRKGQFISEILVAIAIGAILIIGAAVVIAPSLRMETQTRQIQAGAALGKELLENVRAFSESGWNNIAFLSTSSANHYYLVATTSPFTVLSGDETLVVGSTTYTRFFYIDDVGRDGSGNIVSSGGTSDPSTKKVTVVYKWEPLNATYTISTYLTRFFGKVFIQSDWSGGPGYDGPATSTSNKFATSTNIDYSTPGSIMGKF